MNFWLTVLTGISDLDLVFVSHSFPLWMNEAALRCLNSMDSILRIRCWRRRGCICKTFPDKPCVSQILGGPSLRLGIPRERLSIPPGIGWGGKDTGWLVTWDCPLRTDSASSKSLESFMYLTSFCSSWILAMSSRMVSRSSINLLLENSSNVDPWHRVNSSSSLRLFRRASRSSRFCSESCSWSRRRSRRSCSSLAILWSISLCWDPIIPFNLQSESAWTSCFWISVLTSPRICCSCQSRRILILSFSIAWLDFRFWHELSSKTGLPVLVCAKYDWAGNKLSSWEISLSQVRWFFSFLNEQWRR